jgi:hypothetical protein
LAMDGTQHWTTQISSPRTNGFVERMNRTLLPAHMGTIGVFQPLDVLRTSPFVVV